MSKWFISEDLGCVYRWSEKFKQLEYCPYYANGVLDEKEWGCVEENLVGEEMVTFEKKQMALSDVYRKVERYLGVKHIGMDKEDLNIIYDILAMNESKFTFEDKCRIANMIDHVDNDQMAIMFVADDKCYKLHLTEIFNYRR